LQTGLTPKAWTETIQPLIFNLAKTPTDIKIGLDVQCYHMVQDSSGGSANTKTSYTLKEFVEIKNLLYTPPQYKLIEVKFKNFIQSQKNICMGVNRHLRINYRPGLMKFVENEISKVKQALRDFDDHIEVSTTYRHDILGKSETGMTLENLERDVKDDNWLFLCDNQITASRLRLMDLFCRACYLTPLAEVITGIFLGKCTIPLKYTFDLKEETVLDTSVLPPPNTKWEETAWKDKKIEEPGVKTNGKTSEANNENHLIP